MYGPVPTGLASANVAGLPALLQIALGTMAVPAISSRLVYCGVGNVSVTVLPEVLTLEMLRPPRLIDALAFTRSKVKATSAGVSAEPLLHFTPERIVKVICLPLSPHL